MPEPTIEELFAEGGPLARQFEAYEPRRQQVKLASVIDDVIERRANLLAEAGTGTGKTQGYLIPAVRRAMQTGDKVVVVTANIALQEQIVRKDLPIVSKALGGVTFQLVKGVGNYLCRYDFDRNRRTPLNFQHRDADDQWRTATKWASTTVTGDVSELPFELLSEVRRKLTTTSEDCLGSACPERENCHALKARRNARNVTVVVTNYHLFFADLAIKLSGAEGILPPCKILIFDEGHEVADIAREFFGWRLSEPGCRQLIAALAGRKRGNHELPPVSPETLDRCRSAAAQFFHELTRFHQSDDYEVRLRSERPVDERPLAAAMAAAAEHYRQAAEALPLPTAVREDVRSLAERCDTYSKRLGVAMKLADDERNVYYLEPTAKADSVAVVCKPVKVDDVLRSNVFEGDRFTSTIVTSATLTSGGLSGFDLIADELGAEDAEELELGSPFDYSRQAAIVIPDGMPEPNAKGYAEACGRMVVEAARLAHGRTLALFTSWKGLRAAAEAFERANLPWPVLLQGTMPRTQLVAKFKERPSVLLGVKSFWQGIDVPGEALSCVVIDRIPFESPDDPITDSISERDRRWFKHWAIPRAVIDFKQGFGRLIRTSTDVGVVVLLDKRVVTHGYGRMFLRALPKGVRVARSMSAISEVLDRG